MTLTNTTTILRQIGAMGGAGGWGMPDEPMSEEDIGASIHGKRVLSAYHKYRDALVKIGRPATPKEIADAAGATIGAAWHFLKSYPQWFECTETIRNGQKTCLVELRESK